MCNLALFNEQINNTTLSFNSLNTRLVVHKRKFLPIQSLLRVFCLLDFKHMLQSIELVYYFVLFSHGPLNADYEHHAQYNKQGGSFHFLVSPFVCVRGCYYYVCDRDASLRLRGHEENNKPNNIWAIGSAKQTQKE